ncbi:hypothetical protein L2E82_28242 [Cichorium intybus]|uniref:Uncharacterized protein n=1 Tax=Cichorium intybus TaxID=13427 RepID=A0ACB9CV80_CICIN|nr:hypothetical protein L2E82_28242 [Cichorium intybus]
MVLYLNCLFVRRLRYIVLYMMRTKGAPQKNVDKMSYHHHHAYFQSVPRSGLDMIITKSLPASVTVCVYLFCLTPPSTPPKPPSVSIFSLSQTLAASPPPLPLRLLYRYLLRTIAVAPPFSTVTTIVFVPTKGRPSAKLTSAAIFAVAMTSAALPVTRPCYKNMGIPTTAMKPST